MPAVGASADPGWLEAVVALGRSLVLTAWLLCGVLRLIMAACARGPGVHQSTSPTIQVWLLVHREDPTSVVAWQPYSCSDPAP